MNVLDMRIQISILRNIKENKRKLANAIRNNDNTSIKKLGTILEIQYNLIYGY